MSVVRERLELFVCREWAPGGAVAAQPGRDICVTGAGGWEAASGNPKGPPRERDGPFDELSQVWRTMPSGVDSWP